MLLRKSPFSKKLTSDEIESKLKDVVSKNLCPFLQKLFKLPKDSSTLLPPDNKLGDL